jgi:hypothetical protein
VSTQRSFNTFFVLALLSFVLFAVLSKERDTVDRGLEEQARSIVRTLLPPLQAEAEADTIWCYVDAAPAGAIPQDRASFSTDITVRGVGPRDTASLVLETVARNGTLLSPSIVSIGRRRGVGEVADNTISFPVVCRFDSIGRYDLLFTLHTRRLHRGEDGSLVFRDIVIPAGVVTPSLLYAAEHSRLRVRFCVEDSSRATPAAMQALALAAEQGEMQGAVGVEMENPLRVSLTFFDPELRIVRGPGRIEATRDREGRNSFVWRGAPTRAHELVVLEARLRRGAGGKDIARASFAIAAVEPLLRNVLPREVFEGEYLECSFAAAGLVDPARYAWHLYERASNGATFSKDSGRGTSVQYRIPAGFAGKRLMLSVTYDGRPFRCLLADTYEETISNFTFPILEPPLRLDMQLPGRVPATHVFRFLAHQYSDPRFRGDRPVRSTRDIEVRLRCNGGRQLTPVYGMNTYGDFEFTLQNPKALKEGGEFVDLTIRIRGTLVLARKVFLYR